MEIKVQVNSFKTAVQFAKMATRDNPTSPVLGNLLFTYQDGKLYIKGTDMRSTHLTVETPFSTTKVEKGTSFLMEVISLNRLLNTLSDTLITIEPDLVKFAHIVRWNTGYQVVQGEDPTTFPKRPTEPGTIKYELNTYERMYLVDAFKAVNFACDKADWNPVLSGINIRSTETGLLMAAMNSFSSSFYNSTIISDHKLNVTVPKLFALSLIRVNAEVDIEKPLTFTISKTGVQVVLGNNAISCLLIDDAFPDYTPFFTRTSWDKTTTLSKRQLTEALSRLLLTTEEVSPTISITSYTKMLVLESENTGKGSRTHETLEAASTANNFKIVINGETLNEIIKTISGEVINFEFFDQRTAIKIYGEYKDAFCLCMPINPR